ncbi:MAG: beta-lactamase family protein [Chloroflexota bacterium]|jgi:CubicO group peptidase (beta-lactamase class C family)|nr:beta-lactamase family protein [Chloroflexota bacterium]MDH5242379.1 beta-lactamase family protein [Chloroflexota bacterium]
MQSWRRWVRSAALSVVGAALLLAPIGGHVSADPTPVQESNLAAVDAYITTQLHDLGIPGMALSVVQGDQIVHAQGFGTADSSGRAVTPQTPFGIGSITKSFTALAVMQLVEAGKIDLDAPVQRYLPWFRLADSEASARITIRDLLHQTTGISERDGNGFWSSQQGLEDIVRGLDSIQLTQPVGTTHQYSNINYSIAGLVVEKVAGQPYGDYVTQHIFEPLDMRHSFTSRGPAVADGMSDGHSYMFGRAFADDRAVPPVYAPTGSLIASAEDLAHYAIAHLGEGRYGDTAILSPEGIAQLHAPAVDVPGRDARYAMGWGAVTWEGRPVLFHSGDPFNFYSIIMLVPDDDLGFVLLVNASGFEQLGQVDGIAQGVLNLLYDGPAPGPISAPFMTRFLYWAIVLTPFLLILGIALGWRRRNRPGRWTLILTVTLNLVAVVSLFGLSQLIPFPLSSLVFAYPELGYGLIAVATLGIGWSVIFSAMRLQGRRSRRDAPTPATT